MVIKELEDYSYYAKSKRSYSFLMLYVVWVREATNFMEINVYSNDASNIIFFIELMVPFLYTLQDETPDRAFEAGSCLLICHINFVPVCQKVV